MSGPLPVGGSPSGGESSLAGCDASAPNIVVLGAVLFEPDGAVVGSSVEAGLEA
jgi:hypothetical protein